MVWYENSEDRFGVRGNIGDQGEALVQQFCLDTGRVWKDCNDYHSQVILKIDCLVDSVSVDVKTNVKNNKHIVELDGWLQNTSAERIYPVDLINKRIYSYNIEDMRQYIDTERYYVFFSNGKRLASVSIHLPFIERLL